MNTETQPAVTEQAKRTPSARRAEPITKRMAKNGTVSYEFRCDVVIDPMAAATADGSPSVPTPRPGGNYRRITSEVAAGRYVRRTDLTVDRGVRRVAGRSTRHSAGHIGGLPARSQTGAAASGRDEATAADQGGR